MKRKGWRPTKVWTDETADWPTSTPRGFPPDVREAVLSRDQDCQAWQRGFATDVRCQGRLHAHHVQLRSQGGPDTVENGLALCMLHHQLAHDVRRAEAEACGVIVRGNR